MRKINTKLMTRILLFLGMLILIYFLANFLLNKFSVPPKGERLQNRIVYLGREQMGQDEAVDEIEIALHKYTNWNNLFLSENFKRKFKNRAGIINDTKSIASVRSGIDCEYGEDVAVIFVERKSSIFDRDDSDDITTVYYFQFILNENGEIDDLILLEKQDVYTMDGEPVEEI